MNGTLALSIADTFGSGDFPQPSRIMRITFLFIFVVFYSPDGSGNPTLIGVDCNGQLEIAPNLRN
jgi:hypothetical protein